MQIQFLIWDRIIETIKEETPNFSLKYKKYSKFSKFLGKIAPWSKYTKVFTLIYPHLYLPDAELSVQRNPRVLQHEWVHLKDQETFFGIFNKLPKRLNSWLFLFCYFLPQPLALLSLLSFVNLWWLLCLVFLLPLPAPMRMISELRAYRRSLELGARVEDLSKRFTGSAYFFMWPFKKHIIKLLNKKPSPYKELMDKPYLNL